MALALASLVYANFPTVLFLTDFVVAVFNRAGFAPVQLFKDLLGFLI